MIILFNWVIMGCHISIQDDWRDSFFHISYTHSAQKKYKGFICSFVTTFNTEINWVDTIYPAICLFASANSLW